MDQDIKNYESWYTVVKIFMGYVYEVLWRHQKTATQAQKSLKSYIILYLYNYTSPNPVVSQTQQACKAPIFNSEWNLTLKKHLEIWKI